MSLCTIKGRHSHEFNGTHADVSHLQGDISEPRETWCRAHRTYDHDPEHCPLCGGYFHAGPCHGDAYLAAFGLDA